MSGDCRQLAWRVQSAQDALGDSLFKTGAKIRAGKSERFDLSMAERYADLHDNSISNSALSSASYSDSADQ
jgi:hypothetical protein